jgi:uncharacterized membrane protein
MGEVLRRERGLTALLVFAVVGIGISAYLTTLHYAELAPVCTGGGIVDCSSVLKSRWSTVPGTSLPVTVPGMLWFLVSGALAALGLRAAAGGDEQPRRLRAVHAAWAGLGMVGVFYFVFAELVELQRICEWCTVVHLLVLASLLVSLVRLQPAEDTESESDGH